jgi:hypothetical protein
VLQKNVLPGVRVLVAFANPAVRLIAPYIQSVITYLGVRNREKSRD